MKLKANIQKLDKEAALQASLKRKWQIALRRYLIENNPSIVYAPYFGLPAADLKNWLQQQFYGDMNWDNFGTKWNIIQRVPPSLFDLTKQEDLALCWHYINISVQSATDSPSFTSRKIFSSKYFFESIFIATGLDKCKAMVDKLEEIDRDFQGDFAKLQNFLVKNQNQFKTLEEFDTDDFARLNRGEEIEDLLMEKEIIKKYGS